MRARYFYWILGTVGLAAVGTFVFPGGRAQRSTPAAQPASAEAPATASVSTVITSAVPSQSLPAATPVLDSSAKGRAVAAPSSGNAFARFDAWVSAFSSASPASQGALRPEGEALARARYAEMARLIQSDPEQALARALPYRVRQALPAAWADYVEQPLSARGAFTVIRSSPLPGAEEPPPEYEVTIGKQKFRAFTYGVRLRHLPHSGIPLHGVTAQNERGRPILALSARVLRVLEREEAQELIRQGKVKGDARCPICAASPPPEAAIVADLGGEYSTFCQPAHVETLNRLMSDSMKEAWTTAAPAGGQSLPPPEGWSGTQGRKKLLYMPVLYADDPIPPESPDASYSVVANNHRFYKEGSYGIVDWLSTVTEPLQLPYAKNYYGEGIGGTQAASILGDAIAAAMAAGYPVGDYDWHYVVFRSLPQALFGGRSDGLLNGGGGALPHELGHNFGLGHANYIDTSGTQPPPRQPRNITYPIDIDSQVGHDDANMPVRPGKPHVVEYGDNYDVMGSGGGHFNVIFKRQMQWLPEGYIRTVPASETNRIYAFDVPMIFDGRLYALRVRKEGGRDYWISVRQGFPNNPWLANGIELMWDSDSLGSVLIDTTATTPDGKNDSAVAVGRTFADPAADVFITPVAQGGSFSNKWVDVVVQRGPFTNNRPPVLSLTAGALQVAVGDSVSFTATAQDPDGDALAYHWDLGALGLGLNEPALSRTFTNTGHFVVRCEASDMKGGVASAYLVVTCGKPTTYLVSGRVTDSYGNPVPGVRVHNCGTMPSSGSEGTYRYAYTDSQGDYTIANLPAGIHTIRAFRFGYRIEATFPNPQQLTIGDATGLDHIATPLPKVSIRRRLDATEDGLTWGGFTVAREGDLSEELKVGFQVAGTAVRGTHYELLSYAFFTNSVSGTNEGGADTNLATQLLFSAGVARVDLDVAAYDDADGFGNQSVVIALPMPTNATRVLTIFTNEVITNLVVSGGSTNTIVTSNRYPVVVTNELIIPGWELLPVGDRSELTWFQTHPPYVLAGGEATAWILDDDPPALPTVSVATLDVNALETRGDSATLLFTRASSPFTEDLVVRYSLSGAASNGLDYVRLPGTITIPAGQESVLLPVPAVNDLFVEGNEIATLTIDEDPAYWIGSGSASFLIEDDDLPIVTVYASDAVAAKAGANPGRVTVARAGDLSEDLVVNYVVGGTAISGRDFQPLSQTVTLPAHSISAAITIVPIDNEVAGERTVTVQISDSPSYNIFRQNTATVVIRDTLPTVTLNVATDTVSEGGSAGVFRVTRTGSVSNALVVNFQLGGSAAEYYDYSPIGTNVLIAAGAATADINISANTPYNDRAYELGSISGAETVILQLLPGPDYNLGSPSSGTIQFSDNETTNDLPAVGFLLPESYVREDQSLVRLSVKCSANPATNRPIALEYRITTGNAVAGVHYRPLTNGYGLLSFEHYFPPDPPPEFTRSEDTIATFNVQLLNDGVANPGRFFDVQLFYHYELLTNYVYLTNSGSVFTNMTVTPAPTNAWISAYPIHRVHLIDVGETTVSVTADAEVAYEAGAVPGRFVIQREGPLTEDLTVAYSLSGTAAAGNDYVSPAGESFAGTVTIPAGTNLVVLPVVPLDDPIEELAETVVLTVLPQAGYRVSQASAAIVLISDDGTIQFSTARHEVSEGSGQAVITVQRTGDTNRAATVEYRFTDVTALNGLDYQGTNGTLLFAPGEIFKAVTVTILDDPLVEPEETVDLTLLNASGVPLGGQRSATLAILNDDLAFAFTTNLFLANENSGQAAITVLRLGVTSAPVTVRFAALDGSASQPADYLGANLVLTFGPGETTRNVLLPIHDDIAFEGNETVLLRLSEPSTGTVGSDAILQIEDDECALEFAAVTFSTNEYAPALQLTVVRVGGTVNPVRVDFATAPGTARPEDDYLDTGGTLLFAGDAYALATNGSGQLEFQPGDTVKTIAIPLLDDSLLETHEDFRVSLANLQGPEIGALPGATIYGAVTNARAIILDDEMPGSVDFAFNYNSGPNDRVRAVAGQPDGKCVFGGDFTEVDGLVYNRVCRLQAIGGVDLFFNPGFGANSNVHALAVLSDGKIVMAGAFTTMDGSNRLSVVRLKPNGDLDPAFDSSAGPNGTVRALAVDADGRVIIGGEFTQVGSFVRNRLARLKADGTLDTTFTATVNNSVNAIVFQPDGKLVVGGAFTSVNGIARNRLARLNTNGVTDTTLVATFDGPVNALALQADGKIVAGGAFLRVNSVFQSNIVRLQVSGTLDATFQTGRGANAAVNAVAVNPLTGAINLGGDFTSFNAVSCGYFVRLLPNGAIDTQFDVGSGANGPVRSVAVQGDNKVIIGGDFTVVKNLPRRYLARLHGEFPPPPRIAELMLVGGHWTVTFDSQAGKTYTLLSSSNLVNWTPVASAVAPGGAYLLVDPNPPVKSGCYYRLITSQP